MKADGQRTIETIEREIVLAKEFYFAAVTAGALTHANAYRMAAATCDAVAYDLAAALYTVAYDTASEADTQLQTLCSELSVLRAR